MRQDTVHVRVVVPITMRGFRRPDMLRALESPGVTVSHAEIDTGPGSIECEFEAAMAAPGTVAKIIEAEREGVAEPSGCSMTRVAEIDRPVRSGRLDDADVAAA